MRLERGARKVAWPLAIALLGMCVVLAILMTRSHVVDPYSESGASGSHQSAPDSAILVPSRSEGMQLDARLRVEADCKVRCVGSDLSPIMGCTVFGWRDGAEGVMRQAAGEDGIATFQASEGQGGFAAISSRGLFGVLSPIEWQGEHVLKLGGGDRVEGTVLVDGSPAPDGIELRLHASFSEVAKTVPAEVLSQIRELAGALATRTSQGGHFAFSGLPSGFRGTLLPPVTHWLIQPTGSAGASDRVMPARHSLTGRVVGLQLQVPLTGLVVSMTRLPSVSGRVVWDDDGAPVASTNVIVHGEFAQSVKASNRCYTAADGSFDVGLEPSVITMQEDWLNPVRRPQFKRVRIIGSEVPGSLGSVQVDIEFPNTAGPIELRMKRAPRMWFVASDKAGMRIPGARVDVQECAPTERDKAGWFVGSRCSLIGAPGYRVVRAEPTGGDGSPERPLEFELEQVNKLQIMVTGKSGRPAWLHGIVLKSPVPILAGGRNWSEFDGSFGGSRCSSGSRRTESSTGKSQQVYELWIHPDDLGTASVLSMESGIECELMACDETGAELAKSSIVTPPAGTDSEVRLFVEKATSRVRGRLLREDAVAVAHAAVVLATGNRKASAVSRDDGYYEFPSIYLDEAFDVTVIAPGCVKASQRGSVGPDEEVVLDFVMVKGRVVRARVVDESGVPLDLYAQPLGYAEQQAQKLGIGVWQFADLPESVDFFATVQGKRFSARAEANDGEVLVKVTRLARVWASTDALPAVEGCNRENCFVALRSLQHPELDVVYVRFQDHPAPTEYVLPGPYHAAVVVRGIGRGSETDFKSLGISSTVHMAADEMVSLRFD